MSSIETEGGGYTLYGEIVGTHGIGEGRALNCDTTSREDGSKFMEEGPYVVVSLRVQVEQDWAMHHPNLKGIIAEIGGALSHGALVAKEEPQIPCVVKGAGIGDIKTGDQVRVDADTGQVDVNGGGKAPAPKGEGDAIFNVLWENYSWMISAVDKQKPQEMIQYMQSFDLWNGTGITGVIFDNGYVQVNRMPSGTEAEPFKSDVRKVYRSVHEIGTAAPGRGRERYISPEEPGTSQAPAPKMAASETHRFIWNQGYRDFREVDPNNPADPTRLHDAMISEAIEQGQDWWMDAMMGTAVCGVVKNDGISDIYIQKDTPKPEDYPELEKWILSTFPGVKQVVPSGEGIQGISHMHRTAGSQHTTIENEFGLHNGVHIGFSQNHVNATVTYDPDVMEIVYSSLPDKPELIAMLIKKNMGLDLSITVLGEGETSANKDLMFNTLLKKVNYSISNAGITVESDRVEDAIAMIHLGDVAPINQYCESLGAGAPPPSAPVADEPLSLFGATEEKDYQKSIRCPNCDSHSYRTIQIRDDGKSDFNCLTCGTDFKHKVIRVGQTRLAKLDKGTRIEFTRPERKGQRGSVLKDSGTDENFDDELYDILLDSGEELTKVPDSSFKKIKSAKYEGLDYWGNPEDFEAGETVEITDGRGQALILDPNVVINGTRYVKIKPLDDRYEGRTVDIVPQSLIPNSKHYQDDMITGQPILPSYTGTAEVPIPGGVPGVQQEQTCPECGMQMAPGSTECPCGYKIASMQKGAPYPENSEKNAPDHSPPGQHLPKQVNSIYNACMRENPGYGKEKCMKIAWAQHKKSDKKSALADVPVAEGIDTKEPWFESGYEGHPVMCYMCGNTRTAALGTQCEHCGYILSIRRDGPVATKKWAKTATGDPLEVGNWYTMRSTDYDVPDVIKVLELDDDEGITAAIEGDDKGLFPLLITAEEASENSYTFEPYELPVLEAKTARKSFSASEQKDLINENLEGRARNYEKLDLDGTHYDLDMLESKSSVLDDDTMSIAFLW